MNSKDHWLQVLEKAFPQEIPLFLTIFDFTKVNFASHLCMWGLKVWSKICSVQQDLQLLFDDLSWEIMFKTTKTWREPPEVRITRRAKLF